MLAAVLPYKRDQGNAGCSAAIQEGPQKRTYSESNITQYKHRRHNETLNQMALQIINEWYEQNAENPYLNKAQKEQVAKVSGITMLQVNKWFANKHNRDKNIRPKKQNK